MLRFGRVYLTTFTILSITVMLNILLAVIEDSFFRTKAFALMEREKQEGEEQLRSVTMGDA